MSKGKTLKHDEPDNEYGYVRIPTVLSCAVDDIALTDNLLRYLVAIGSYSTKRNGNWCWPSRDTIAKRMGVSPRAVTKAMATLAELGYIEIRPRFDDETGKQLSNNYRVLLDFELPAHRARSHQGRTRTGIGGRQKNTMSSDVTPGTPAVPPPLELQSSTPPGTPAVPPPLELQQFHQNMESESGKGNITIAAAAISSPRARACEDDAAAAAWNDNVLRQTAEQIRQRLSMPLRNLAGIEDILKQYPEASQYFIVQAAACAEKLRTRPLKLVHFAEWLRRARERAEEERENHDTANENRPSDEDKRRAAQADEERRRRLDDGVQAILEKYSRQATG